MLKVKAARAMSRPRRNDDRDAAARGPTQDNTPTLTIDGNKQRILLTRRYGILTVAGFIFSACSESNVITHGVRTILAENVNAAISRSQIGSIPYASMSAKFGDGPRGIIILGNKFGEDLHWFIGGKGVLVTRGGRLVKTAGLNANLKRTSYIVRDPLSKNLKGFNKRQLINFSRIVDVGPPDRYGVRLDSSFDYIGTEKVEIVELAFHTHLVVERCVAAEFNWRFENSYWIGIEDGLVWKSIQHVHPELPPVELQLLKPYVG